MKAALFYEANDMRIEDIEIPKLKAEDVLIKVHACGICGTDVHIYSGDEGCFPTPAGTALGHEFAGEIAEIGEGVTTLKIGDRVAVDPNWLCNRCSYCLEGIGHFCENMTGIGTSINGGFAEYCVVPYWQAYKFSPALSYNAAAMTEPVSCCLHGIDLCNIKPGATVAVIGCGMIGLLMLQLARISGAAKLIAIEPIERKREEALKLGADFVFNPIDCDLKAELEAVGIKRIDTVIECVGRTSTIETAIEIAGNYSTVMMFGLTAPDDKIAIKPFEIFKKEITLKSSFINPYTFTRALALIESGKIDVESMVYKIEPLSELPDILANPERRREGKIIIDCTK